MTHDPRVRERDPDANYDAADDLRRSVEFAYGAIRERVARGGHGWRGWPEPVIRNQIEGSAMTSNLTALYGAKR
jgi:hypothetical protein